MHRHGYKGRKFHRETDQRRALMKGLADALVEHGSIETTLPKAKELRRYIEKLVTKAKRGDLHSRRTVITKLQTKANAHRLMDEIAPKYKDRSGGYVRIQRSGFRRGDNAEMAVISFVDSEQKNATKTDTASEASEATAEKTKSKQTTSQPAKQKTTAKTK
jgi:large subunit ribosomal protein L17